MKMETYINRATPTSSQLWGDAITESSLKASHEGWLRSPPDLQCSGATAPRAPTAPSPGAEQPGWDWRAVLLRSSMVRALFSKRSLNKSVFFFPVTALHSQLLTALKMAPIEIIISY